MFLYSLAFLCGIVFVAHLTHLPDIYWVGVLLIFSASLFFLFKQRAMVIIFMMSGIAWALLYAHHALSWTLPDTLENKLISVTGTIASIPVIEPFRTSFLFSFNTVEDNPASGVANVFYAGRGSLHVGDQWQFQVRLKKSHGLMNPGGMDLDAISFEKGIKASGIALFGHAIAHHGYSHPVDRLREKLIAKITEAPTTVTLPWIVALATGERQHIDSSSWDVLRQTGTNHLMVIGGLHIGFVAAFAALLVSFLWRRIPRWTLRWPAMDIAAVSALCIAIGYGAMAGFSVSTERADMMLAVVVFCLLNRRKILPWTVWSISLFIVLLCNPFCVLSSSVWLSFSSIAVILYAMSARLSPTGLWWKHGRIQWVMVIGLLPLSIGVFQECSWISFIANSIAIPIVGFIILPCVLFGCFCFLFSSYLAHVLIHIADIVMGLVWKILVYLSHFSWSISHVASPPRWMIASSIISIIIFLSPRGLPGRSVGLFFLLPLIVFHPSKPSVGEAWVTLLDVGQGLSVVVQTHHHILVFDAGEKTHGHDRGKDVVVPFLYSVGANHIDKLVVSHGDNDHIGGAFSLIQTIPAHLIETSVPERFKPVFAELCLRGEKWNWDGVEFTFLYPTPNQLGLDNNSSCVLRVATRGHSILLTGDIEKQAEEYIVSASGRDLASDILVAPHHGSKTSDLKAFVDAVDPRIVLFPVGYLNRYHLPSPSVVEAYQERGAELYDSVRDGAIQFVLRDDDKAIPKPFLYRREHAHFFSG